MAGSEPKISLEGNQSKAGSDIVGDWIAPILTFVLVVGIFFALVGAILAPAD